MTGIRIYDIRAGTHDHMYLFMIHLVLLIVLTGLNEYLYAARVYTFNKSLTSRNYNVVTKEDVALYIKEGRMLAYYGKYVVDLSTFCNRHPGGL